jgi:hypothetical protein
MRDPVKQPSLVKAPPPSIKSSHSINRSKAQEKIAKENARLAKRLSSVKASSTVAVSEMRKHASDVKKYSKLSRQVEDAPQYGRRGSKSMAQEDPYDVMSREWK